MRSPALLPRSACGAALYGFVAGALHGCIRFPLPAGSNKVCYHRLSVLGNLGEARQAPVPGLTQGVGQACGGRGSASKARRVAAGQRCRPLLLRAAHSLAAGIPQSGGASHKPQSFCDLEVTSQHFGCVLFGGRGHEVQLDPRAGDCRG